MLEHLKRYRVIFPAEHGSWSLMIVPFLTGAGVAAAVGAADGYAVGGVVLCLLAVLALFLARQPLTLWMRIARGKGPASRLQEARFWTLLLALVGAGAGTGLLVLGRWPLLWLAIPAAAVLTVTLAIQTIKGPRLLVTELVGVVGLALGAPAAYVSAAGRLDDTAWLVWGLAALHNVISVLYVRLRIDHQHGRATERQSAWVIAAHILSLLAVVALAAIGWLPWPVGLAMALLLVRALIVARQHPPIENVQRFGLTEMGLALAFAALVIAAFAFLH
jgi:hypothetical protein